MKQNYMGAYEMGQNNLQYLQGKMELAYVNTVINFSEMLRIMLDQFTSNSGRVLATFVNQLPKA